MLHKYRRKYCYVHYLLFRPYSARDRIRSIVAFSVCNLITQYIHLTPSSIGENWRYELLLHCLLDMLLQLSRLWRKAANLFFAARSCPILLRKRPYSILRKIQVGDFQKPPKVLKNHPPKKIYGKKIPLNNTVFITYKAHSNESMTGSPKLFFHRLFVLPIPPFRRIFHTVRSEILKRWARMLTESVF